MGDTNENVEINYSKILETAPESRQGSAQTSYIFNRREKMYSRYVPNKRLSRYNASLKGLLPFRQTSQEVLSIEYAGFFSQITFFWMWKYIFQARKSSQNESISPTCPQSDSCMRNAPRLDGKWSEIAVKHGNNSGSMTYVAWLFARTRIIIGILIYLIGICFSIVGLLVWFPEILKNISILRKLDCETRNETNAKAECFTQAWEAEMNSLLNVIVLGVMQTIACFWVSWSNSITLRTALRLRAACLSNIYRRVMTTSVFYDVTTNQIITFMVPNGKFVEEMILHMPKLIASPIILIGCIITSSIYLSPFIFICFATLVLIHVILFMMVSLYSEPKYNKAFEVSYQRLELLEELVSNIFNIKIFLHDRYFKRDIKKTREDEINFIRSSQFVENLCLNIIQLIPIFAMIPLFIAYVDVREYDNNDDGIQAMTVFPILLIFVKLSMENFFVGINALCKGSIALKMLKGVMRLESVSTHVFKPTNTDVAISVNNGEFMHATNQNKAVIMSYSKKGASLKMKRPNLVSLKEIDFSIDKGQVIGICGHTDSGKTSLLHAILGHLKELKATTHKALKTDGQFAYIAEEPFIFDGSIKDNILFGHSMDSKRYMSALQNSGLSEELNHLNENDGTIISKSAISLSFSQRIDLARAIHANKDIYLLDRFLSAVEMQFSNKIFESSILQSLKGKTIILVTDKPSFLMKCDCVYMMYNGTIIDMGTHDQLINRSDNYSQFIAISNERNSKMNIIEERFGTIRSVRDESSLRKKSLASLASVSSVNALESFSDPLSSRSTIVYNMNVADSNIDLHGNQLYKVYFDNFGLCGRSILGVLYLVEAICMAAIPLFLICNFRTVFQEAYFLSMPNVDLTDEILAFVLIAIIACLIICGILGNLYFSKKIFQPALKLHNELIEKLCNATIHYFQATKLTTILSTISFSFHSTDFEIPQLIRKTTITVFNIVATLVVIGLAAYPVVLPLLIMSSLYLVCVGLVLYAFLRYNWFEVYSRNDIFSQVISTVSGRATIQAYNKQNEFTNSFFEKCEKNMVYIFLLDGVKHWMSFILNMISVCVLVVVGCCIPFIPGLSMVEAALAIVCTILYCDLMTSLAECISELVCSFATLSYVDNLHEDIDSEHFDVVNNIELNEAWPEIGNCSISFRSLSASLMNDNFFEIVNLSCAIKSGETIGIYGLSNSGRQTFTSALFRLIPINKGKIIIGGHDIVQVPKEKMRSVISYVPHEPVLFNKSVLSYLNPDGELKERDVIDALKKVELYETISFLPDGLHSLPNENLSMGEKQLLCLARAYLRKSKIILIEQNAANIGTPATNSLETALTTLFHDSTVIILAEHLHSLVNCDRAMIIENGVLVEMDSPKKLYLNAKSRFSLVLKTYDETSI